MSRWTATATERFWQKVRLPADQNKCWTWIGAHLPEGYGRFWADGEYIYAHRFALSVIGGQPLIAGLEVDHLCRNPSCVNPTHLEQVTHRTNGLRGNNHNRIKTACLRGHLLSGKNLRISADGKRSCGECARVHQLIYYYQRRVTNGGRTVAGTSSNRQEELDRVARIETNNQNSSRDQVGSTVKKTGIGTSLAKNPTSGGGVNRRTQGISQK